jgi:adenine deaminase
MLRYSSLRPDLPELLRAVTEDGVSTHRLVMTTDGPAPEFAAEHGLVDGMLRVAVENGVPPMQALRMVTINPATLFRIDGQVGGIGIGRRADLLLLPVRRRSSLAAAWWPRTKGSASGSSVSIGRATEAGRVSRAASN